MYLGTDSLLNFTDKCGWNSYRMNQDFNNKYIYVSFNFESIYIQGVL